MRPACISLGVLSLLVAPLAATAAPVTYDFTATVYSASGSLDSVQGLIDGTLTFDLDNAQLATGAIGSSTWIRQEQSGSDFVFSMTASTGSTLLYSTASPGAYSSQSSVQGQSGSIYQASESQLEDPAGLNSRGSSLGLSAHEAVYDAGGLPIFGEAGEFASGSFTTEMNGLSGTVDFGILSVTPAPVPLPAAGGLLAAGLAGLGLLRRRRSR